MSINSINVFQDPNVYAQQYANQNNMSLEEAKSELKAKYGDPQQPSLNFQNSSNPFTSDSIDTDTVYEEAGKEQLENLLKGLTELITQLLSALKEFMSADNKEEEETSTTSTSSNTTTSNNTTNSTSNSTSNTSSSSDNNNTDNSTKTQDDKYQSVAEATGIDKKTVSAIMKYIASGNVTGAPENVVPQVAKALGIREYAVATVLKYCNNGKI